jgi:hypothetical protein
MRRERCLKCDFFKPVDNENGTCYRYPPIPIIVNNRIRMMRPEILTDDFCDGYKCLSEK